MKKPKVLIVGGGSAGWMTAAYLNGALNQRGEKPAVEICLIESPDIPRISVGEATIPSIRHLLAVAGIDELAFMKATDATFKQSIKYVNWLNNDNSFYHHPFSSMRVKPLDKAGSDWLKSDRSIPFMETCSAQPILCELGLAPRMLGQWDMGAPLNYAFHLNAQKFADYLRDFSVSRGVQHVYANVQQVNLKAEQQIGAVVTDSAGEFSADLFIDCSGFKALLIEGALGVGFEDLSPWLLCDRAITMHVPYDTFYPGQVRPYTTATAMSNGWIWDIPMQHQRSVGYVHASAFISAEQAERELRAYQGIGCEQLPTRTVQFKVGRRKQHWFGNCIAIGLSGGFIEPLESTGLYLGDLGVVLLAEHFPHQAEQMATLAARYNRIMTNRYYEILDFINMHYCLTQRTDSEFWREVSQPHRINDRLAAKFEYWRAKPPTPHDYQDPAFWGYPNQAIASASSLLLPPVDTGELWNHESYECILYGMDFLRQECEQWYGQVRPVPRVHPAIMMRLQMARQKIPPHALWLQKVLAMQQYQTAAKPAGWG
jgi:tryptophan 7-halogenase